MHGLLLHIRFERRRLATAGCLAYVAGFLLHMHLNFMVFGVPFPVFTGLVYLISVVLTGVVTTYLLPGIRRLIDCIAVSRLGFALFIVGVQGQEFEASPIVSASIVVIGAIVIHRLGGQLNKVSQLTDVQGIVVEHFRVALDWVDNKAEREVKTKANKANDWSPAPDVTTQTPSGLLPQRNASIDV